MFLRTTGLHNWRRWNSKRGISNFRGNCKYIKLFRYSWWNALIQWKKNIQFMLCLYLLLLHPLSIPVTPFRSWNQKIQGDLFMCFNTSFGNYLVETNYMLERAKIFPPFILVQEKLSTKTQFSRSQCLVQW